MFGSFGQPLTLFGCAHNSVLPPSELGNCQSDARASASSYDSSSAAEQWTLEESTLAGKVSVFGKIGKIAYQNRSV